MKLATGVTLLMTIALAQPALAESKFDREVQQLGALLVLREGSVAADIGAGDGEYAIALSRRVGASGKIYATELSEEDREDIEAAAREQEATRVEVASAELEATGLPVGCCDGVVLRTVYHHLTAPEPFVRSLFETVRPGGRLVIVDFPPTIWLALWPPDGVPENRGGHGITPELVIEELEAAGFVHLETIPKWPSRNLITKDYGVVFERPAESR